MNNNRGTIIGLIAVVVIAVGALVFFMSRQNAGTSDSTVKELQNEAAKNVPSDIGKPDPEMVHADLHQMGGGGKTSTAPPVGGAVAK
jgi:hypothetical protein